MLNVTYVELSRVEDRIKPSFVLFFNVTDLPFLKN